VLLRAEAGPQGRDGVIARVRKPFAPVAATLLTVAIVCGAGCGGSGEPAPDLAVECTTVPSPPVVGVAQLELAVRDAAGASVTGATVRIEGNMNHAGMTPSFAEAREIEPGRYQADLDFTMAGDWFLLVDVTLADGRTARRKVDVPSVKRK